MTTEDLTISDISREDFMAYLDVQMGGQYNMFDPRAQIATGLPKDKYMFIIRNYDELLKKYGEEVD